MFTTIFVILIVLLIAYYIVMIALDLTKPDGDVKKEDEDNVEVDISAERAEFQPVEVTRKQPQQINTVVPQQSERESLEEQEKKYVEATHPTKENINEFMKTIGTIPNDVRSQTVGKQPIMTDAFTVSDILTCVEDLSTKGKSDLGDIIYECQSAA